MNLTEKIPSIADHGVGSSAANAQPFAISADRARHRIELLGPLRFLMAVSVVLTHLWANVAPDAGRHAVIGFFCISGFLITRISRSAYRGRPGAFLVNRLLRIYPQYIVAMLLGAVVVTGLPDAAASMNSALRLPVTAGEWLRQFTIFGLATSPVRLSPPTWSLNIELYFYLAIGLVTHRSERATYAMLALSAIVAGLALAGIAPIGFYGSALGNAFVFYLGSAAYFVSRRLQAPSWLGPIALTWYGALAYVFPWLGDGSLLRDGLLVASVVAMFLILLRPPVIETDITALRTVANFLGRLSYPIFLVHWAVSGLVFAMIGRGDPFLFLAVLALSLLVASGMVLAIDRPIELLRARIRAAGRARAETEKPTRSPGSHLSPTGA